MLDPVGPYKLLAKMLNKSVNQVIEHYEFDKCVNSNLDLMNSIIANDTTKFNELLTQALLDVRYNDIIYVFKSLNKLDASKFLVIHSPFELWLHDEIFYI